MSIHGRQVAHGDVPVGRTYPSGNAVGGVCAEDRGFAESSGVRVHQSICFAGICQDLLLSGVTGSYVMGQARRRLLTGQPGSGLGAGLPRVAGRDPLPVSLRPAVSELASGCSGYEPVDESRLSQGSRLGVWRGRYSFLCAPVPPIGGSISHGDSEMLFGVLRLLLGLVSWAPDRLRIRRAGRQGVRTS
jgi:hypothetical protein